MQHSTARSPAATFSRHSLQSRPKVPESGVTHLWLLCASKHQPSSTGSRKWCFVCGKTRINTLQKCLSLNSQVSKCYWKTQTKTNLAPPSSTLHCLFRSRMSCNVVHLDFATCMKSPMLCYTLQSHMF